MTRRSKFELLALVLLIAATSIWFFTLAGKAPTNRFSVVEIIAFDILTGGTPVALFLVPQFWRGDNKHMYEEGTRPWWLWGEPLRKAWVRSMHLGVFGTLGAAGAGFFIFAGDGGLIDPRTADEWGLRCVIFMLFIMGLALLVTLFNRPKFIVPPVYRDEPGVVQHYLRGLIRRLRKDAPEDQIPD